MYVTDHLFNYGSIILPLMLHTYRFILCKNSDEKSDYTNWKTLDVYKSRSISGIFQFIQFELGSFMCVCVFVCVCLHVCVSILSET